MRNWHKRLDWEKLSPWTDLFFSRDTWMDGVLALRNIFAENGGDENGFKMLACMLKASCRTYDDYMAKGIRDEIFTATFGMFSRFLKEHLESFGVYGFDRDFWTCRVIAMEEFRLGIFEYELESCQGRPCISMHIPSDVTLSPEACRASVKMAEDFFKQYFPEYASVSYFSDSWLLSPVLKEVLPEDSNIMKFQKAFRIGREDVGNDEYLQWVFKNPALPIEELPEETSLQKKLKVLLKNGRKVWNTLGFLTDKDFGV